MALWSAQSGKRVKLAWWQGGIRDKVIASKHEFRSEDSRGEAQRGGIV